MTKTSQQVPLEHTNSGHYHNGRQLSYKEWITLLKELLEIQLTNSKYNWHSDCGAPEEHRFQACLEKLNEVRSKNTPSYTPVKHAHDIAFTEAERTEIIQKIANDVNKESTPMNVVSQDDGEIIYGDPKNEEKQITYNKQEDGTWLITAGKQVNAVIIDPAGKIIEVHGDHMHVTGEGGNLRVPKDLERPDHSLSEVRNQQHHHGSSAACATLVQ